MSAPRHPPSLPVSPGPPPSAAELVTPAARAPGGDFDVFNGDADGICALHQLRLADPRDAELITGAKREISLLARVNVILDTEARQAGRITVLDISVERNRVALERLLDRGAAVQWFDHHEPGQPPVHPRFEPWLDTDSAVCTSILVDRYLGGRYRRWAICAAFGDNMMASALALARLPGPEQVSREAELQSLKRIGEALNYNAYAADTGTAVLAPEELYRQLAGITDPLALADWGPIRTLARMSLEDLQAAMGTGPILDLPRGCAWLLPPTVAARRARGLLGQHLRGVAGSRALLIIAPDGQGFLDISVRCPANAVRPASDFARRYDGGGGRATAAGIDHLPADRLDALLIDFERWLAGRDQG